MEGRQHNTPTGLFPAGGVQATRPESRRCGEPGPAIPELLEARGKTTAALPPDAELFDQPSVAGNVARVEVVEQTAPLAYQAQQSEARMVVFLVRCQMLGQLLNATREQRDLNFRRAAIVESARVGLY